MVQVTQKEVRRYMGVGSTVVGLVCHALSSSFTRLYGEWSSFKICAYIVSSSIICLAILFPKAWQHLSIFEHRAHMTFLVMTSTTVYSFYLDRKMNTKPDAYAPISSAAFATTSLCMSKQVECGFVDLLYFFCGLLITQLMKITPLLGFVGIGFSYFVVILRSYLDDAPPNGSQSQPPQVVIDTASLLQSSALDARPEEEEEGSNQNQAAIAPVYSFAALGSASLRYRSSTSRASSLGTRTSRSASRRSRTRRARALDIHQNQPITEEEEEEANFHSAVDDFRYLIFITPLVNYLFCPDLGVWIKPRTRVVLGGDWIRTHQERVLEIFQDCQRSSWNKLLNNLQNRRNDESLIWDMIEKHNLFSLQFKDMCYLLSNWLVSDKQLRDNLKTSWENILLPTYDYFRHSNRFLALLGEHAHNNFIKYEVPDILAGLRHLFHGKREIDQPLVEKGKKLKIE